jgi:FMN phosphatase YigB (HAD superfamily)
MSIKDLESVDPDTFDLLSVDVFDTVLLRDLSGQSERFAEISSLATKSLAIRGQIVDARPMTSLRMALHDQAYRAASIERPLGEVLLNDVHALQARLLNGGPEIVALLREAELSIERRRLSPNRRLLQTLKQFASSGKRVIAVSDTYYATDDLVELIGAVLGYNPFLHVYASSDVGLTKHAGGIFAAISTRERTAGGRILHVGDDVHADIAMARAAGWRAIHLPRPAAVRAARTARAVLSRVSRSRGRWP